MQAFSLLLMSQGPTCTYDNVPIRGLPVNLTLACEYVYIYVRTGVCVYIYIYG